MESNFSFLTQSTLIVASVAPTAAVPLTDPDQPTTTLNIPNAGATNSLTQAALPTGIPSRIFPQNGIPDGTDMSGLTLISILFNSELNWPFVASHQDSSSQIFAFFPTVLQTALGLSGVLSYYFLRLISYTLFVQPIKSKHMACKYMYQRRTRVMPMLHSLEQCTLAMSHLTSSTLSQHK